MAPRASTVTKTSQNKASDKAVPVPDLKSLIVASGPLPKVSRTREGGENPLAGAVVLGTPLQIPVSDSTQAKAVTALLRRDAQERGLGLRIVYQAGEEFVTTKRETNSDGKEVTVYPAGITAVHFEGKKKNVQKYTTKDIREWHKAKTGENITGAVPATVRDAYRKEHGYAKDTKSA